MFYPNVIPHAELLIPENYLEEYRGKYLPEKKYEGTEPGDERFRIGGYGSTTRVTCSIRRDGNSFG